MILPPLQKFFNAQESAFVSDFHPQNEANKIKKEAEELDQLMARKLKDYEDLREDMKGKELEVKNLLEKGKTEQQVSSVLCRPVGKKTKGKQVAGQIRKIWAYSVLPSCFLLLTRILKNGPRREMQKAGESNGIEAIWENRGCLPGVMSL